MRVKGARGEEGQEEPQSRTARAREADPGRKRGPRRKRVEPGLRAPKGGP